MINWRAIIDEVGAESVAAPPRAQPPATLPATVTAIVTTASGMADPWQALVFLLESFVRNYSADHALFELLFSNDYCAEQLLRLRERMIPAVVALVRRGQEAGVVRPDLDSSDLPVLQLTLGVIAKFAATVSPELWRRHLGLLLDGLRTRRDAPTPLPRPPLTQDQLFEAFDRFHP